MPGVNDWVAKASGDLKASKKLIKDDDDTLDCAAYFTQQSAEKAFKAYLIFKQQPIPRTHDLEKLLKDCIKYDGTFD
jgi:HEPN domain-containing protein